MDSKRLTKSQIEKVLGVFRLHIKPTPLSVYTTPYEVLVSILLSARTKDETTLVACQRLFKKASSVTKLQTLSISELESLIYPVGFYKTKAKHLSQLADQLISTFNGTVPRTRGELMELPGVGRKTANLVLQRLGIESTIAVDTHVHTISNLLGWVKTKTPEETERELMKMLPKKYWHEINSLFVSIGQQN